MKKLLLLVFFIVFPSLFFISCTSNESVTPKECKSKGLKYKKEKVLNLRTGKHEIRVMCK